MHKFFFFRLVSTTCHLHLQKSVRLEEKNNSSFNRRVKEHKKTFFIDKEYRNCDENRRSKLKLKYCSFSYPSITQAQSNEKLFSTRKTKFNWRKWSSSFLTLKIHWNVYMIVFAGCYRQTKQKSPSSCKENEKQIEISIEISIESIEIIHNTR